MPCSIAVRTMTESGFRAFPETSMTQDELKQAVARAARDYVADRLPQGAILGVGTGSTANRVGKLLRRLQSGNMSFYLFSMVVGLIALLAWTLYHV